MRYWFVNYSRGQLKIQQMAFVLVALIILFSMASLVYFSIKYSNLKNDVESLREQNVIESVRKLSGTAEFSWTASGDCSSCIDLDKVLVLKDMDSYENFWKDVSLLQISRVYPKNVENKECTKQNYPNCDTLTLVDKKDKEIRGHKAFVALCRYELDGRYNKCELGKIVMGFETIK